MNVEIGTEVPIFLFWEYLFQSFGILSLQCGIRKQISSRYHFGMRRFFSDVDSFSFLKPHTLVQDHNEVKCKFLDKEL